MSLDISVIVTAHREGRLLHRTLRSVAIATEHASQAGVESEVVVVADSADENTLSYIALHRALFDRVVTVEVRSLGLARNAGVDNAAGRYVTFVDGDDLVSTNWLIEAHRNLERSGPIDVVHPEYVVAFGALRMVTHYLGSADPRFKRAAVFDQHPWTSTVACRRDLFKVIRYRSAEPRDGFGYEDWLFATEVLGQGGDIVIASETCMFYRKKTTGSLLEESVAKDVLMPRTPLFSPASFLEYVGSANRRTPSRWRAWGLRRIGSAIRSKVPSLLPLAEGALKSHLLLKARYQRSTSLPQWLRRELHDVHRTEPLLYPSIEYLEARRFEPNERDDLGATYASLCRVVATRPTHVLLVPWLRRGGADLEALNYLHLLSQQNGSRVAVVATHPDADSPWESRVPEQAVFIPFGRLSRHLAYEDRRALLARLLVQWHPAVIHILNSREGWEVLSSLGSALSESTVFASVFCEDLTDDGQRVGYPFEFLPDSLEYLDGVFADNRRILELLDDTYSIDPVYQAVHHNPVEQRTTERRRLDGSLRVLWAGRLDRQRRPDVLVDIAALAEQRSLPVTFDAFGSLMLDRRVRRNRKLPSNLTFRGPFDGLGSLALSTYDLFLNTSEWDGLPNVLLEAAAVGLPVMSSAVGGIPELISHRQTGYLVRPFDDVKGYVDGLQRILEDPSQLETMATQLRSQVARDHSWDRFRAEVAEAPGYIV